MREKGVRRYRVVVADPLSPAGLKLLEESGVELHLLKPWERADLSRLVADADALLVRSSTLVDAELLCAGKRLKVVGRVGNGVNNIDLDTATRRRIAVVNAPDASSVSVAELTVGMILALARSVPAADASVKAEKWNRRLFLGTELQGKTLGLIGLGRIGRQVAVRARAFDMRVIAHDPNVDPTDAARFGVAPVELRDLLRHADFVSLHVPLIESTRGLLDAAAIAAMKPGAFLLNLARGGLIDESALYEALESGHLGGAALDVFSEEPPGDLPLARHPRVVSTPHLGAQTREAQDRAAVEVVDLVLSILGGARDVRTVNSFAGGLNVERDDGTVESFMPIVRPRFDGQVGREMMVDP